MWCEETALHNALEKKSPPRNTLRSWFSTDLKMHLSFSISSDADCTAQLSDRTGARTSLHPARKQTEARCSHWGWGIKLPSLVAIPLLHAPFGKAASASGQDSWAVMWMRWQPLCVHWESFAEPLSWLRGTQTFLLWKSPLRQPTS